jgi:hypothetical protein
MSGHDESIFVISGKESVALPFGDIEDEEFTTRDSREEEERRTTSCQEYLPVPSREEDRVQLYPRFNLSFDGDEHDQFSMQAACSSSSLRSLKVGSFLRKTSAPPPIPHTDEPHKRDKPSLYRSMAWSQDSLEDRRNTKRCRREEAINDVFSFSGFQHNRQSSADGLTAIHWEEKIVDSMQLVSFLDKAATISSNAEMESA